MAENSDIVIYSFLVLGTLIGVFKSIDWLISIKYRTKDECERCRNLIYEAINKDRDLLVRLDAKMDLVLEKMKEVKYD
ncbi:MAG: hypothetical protein IKU37_09235 [Candidatus Gastranaerophilales bacterium]|nr:hypothetical protein [Candidatus Gastranaerophilales bacterium]